MADGRPRRITIALNVLRDELASLDLEYEAFRQALEAGATDDPAELRRDIVLNRAEHSALTVAREVLEHQHPAVPIAQTEPPASG